MLPCGRRQVIYEFGRGRHFLPRRMPKAKSDQDLLPEGFASVNPPPVPQFRVIVSSEQARWRRYPPLNRTWSRAAPTQIPVTRWSMAHASCCADDTRGNGLPDPRMLHSANPRSQFSREEGRQASTRVGRQTRWFLLRWSFRRPLRPMISAADGPTRRHSTNSNPFPISRRSAGARSFIGVSKLAMFHDCQNRKQSPSRDRTAIRARSHAVEIIYLRPIMSKKLAGRQPNALGARLKTAPELYEKEKTRFPPELMVETGTHGKQMLALTDMNQPLAAWWDKRARSAWSASKFCTAAGREMRELSWNWRPDGSFSGASKTVVRASNRRQEIIASGKRSHISPHGGVQEATIAPSTINRLPTADYRVECPVQGWYCNATNANNRTAA